MNSNITRCKSRDFLVVILFLQSIAYATVFLDVPVARQVIGFIYFTFVPGFVVIKLLKLNKLDGLETVVFSVGLSVAFLMIAGLLINEFGFLFGFSEPLSKMPLLITLNGFIFVGAVLACLRSESVKLWKVKNLGLFRSALLLIGLPVLSVVGAMWVNAYGNNWILLFLIIAISLLFVIGVTSKKLLPSKLYPLAVLMIAISLLYHSSLISNYIVSFGSDVPVEYFVFKTTQNNAYWSSTNPYLGDIGYGRVHSMLSVTILPTIYSSLLNMDSTWVFKIIFPLIFSFVPLGLYQVWKGHVGKKYAFISAFLFMAYEIFYTEMLGLNRQMIAELFFVLLLLVVLNNKMKPSSKMMCFVIFSFGLVTSHYGLSQILLLFISLTFISLFVVKRPSRNITASMVVLFFVVMFTWYIYTSGSAVFDSFLEFGDYVYSQLGEFFNPASRGQTVLRGLGLESPPTIWNAISRAFAYATQLLIVVGFVGLITKRVKVHFERDYFTFSFIATAFLAALILVPGLANTMNMTRFYHILLFFLAPLCALGTEFLVKLISKRRTEIGASILLLIVLVPYFLFQTGFMYEVTGTQSWSLPLSKHRMDAVFLRRSLGYFDECDVFGALWISKNMDVENSKTYADAPSAYVVLSSYGMIYSGNMEVLSNVTVLSTNANVYFSRANVVDGVVVGSDYLWNTTSISPILGFANKVYSNGGCEIYKNGETS